MKLNQVKKMRQAIKVKIIINQMKVKEVMMNQLKQKNQKKLKTNLMRKKKEKKIKKNQLN